MLRNVFGSGGEVDWPVVVLPRLIERLREALAAPRVKPSALYDRLCATFRAMDFDPPPRALWNAAAGGKVPVSAPTKLLAAAFRRPLDEEGWNRVGLLIASMADPAVAEVVRQRSVERGTAFVTACLLIGFASWADGLTSEALAQTPSRLEELARKWTSAIGARIRGESEAESLKRLRAVDFGDALGAVRRAGDAKRP